MGKTRLATTALLITILLVSAIGGTVFYFNRVINERDSQIASLKTQITTQNNEITNLTNQIANFNAQSANLTTKLGIIDYENNSSSSAQMQALRNGLAELGFDGLYIKGTVANEGNMTAYNAGLYVVGYDANNTLEINMTVPLVYAANSIYNDAIDFGTDNVTQVFADNTNSANGVVASLKLGSLDGGKAVLVSINIFHEGVVSNWTVTPVWTN